MMMLEGLVTWARLVSLSGHHAHVFGRNKQSQDVDPTQRGMRQRLSRFYGEGESALGWSCVRQAHSRHVSPLLGKEKVKYAKSYKFNIFSLKNT